LVGGFTVIDARASRYHHLAMPTPSMRDAENCDVLILGNCQPLSSVVRVDAQEMSQRHHRFALA
jgi:hypothetical protein